MKDKKTDDGKLTPANVWMQGTVQDWNARDKQPDKSMQAYTAWSAAPGPDTAGELLKHLRPTIDSALNSYAPDMKDQLRARAELMALSAARTYDAAKGTRLPSHVFNNLKGLNREKARRGTMVHIPENKVLELNRLRGAEASFESEQGREPTAAELADATGLSIKRIEKIRDSGGERSESGLLNEHGDSLFARQEDPQRIWADYVYHDLDDQDKKIFEWSTGYGGAARKGKGEMAKALRMSPAAVSRRIGKIVQMLQRGQDV